MRGTPTARLALNGLAEHYRRALGLEKLQNGMFEVQKSPSEFGQIRQNPHRCNVIQSDSQGSIEILIPSASPIFGSRDGDCWIHGGRCVRCNRKTTTAQRARDYEHVLSPLFQGTSPTATGPSRWNASIVVKAVRELPNQWTSRIEEQNNRLDL